MSKQKVTAKINQKLALRFAAGLLTLAVIFYGIQALMNKGSDLDVGTFDSKGYISASMETSDGTVAVLIGPDGKVQEAPDRPQNRSDLAPIWNTPGDRLYFISDREDSTSHVFRWNPNASIGSKVQRRSLDGRSKTFLTFQAPGGSDTALMITGGTVIEFDPAKGKSTQLLPPMGRDLGAKGGEGSGGSSFDQMYQQLGDSFRVALWGPEKEWIAAVMRRETGEILIIQHLQTKDGRPSPPIPVMAGDKIEIDVAENGKVAVTVLNFQFNDPDNPPEEFIKDGKVVPPFRTYVGLLDVAKQEPPEVIFAAMENSIAFSSPKFSPDGSRLLLQVGSYKPGDGFKVNGLVSVPAERDGGNKPTPIVPEPDCYDAVWSPNGDKVIFTKVVRGNSGIWEISKDGGKPTRIGPEDQNFAGPRYSPQSR